MFAREVPDADVTFKPFLASKYSSIYDLLDSKVVWVIEPLRSSAFKVKKWSGVNHHPHPPSCTGRTGITLYTLAHFSLEYIHSEMVLKDIQSMYLFPPSIFRLSEIAYMGLFVLLFTS